jgi:hypothetical protein
VTVAWTVGGQLVEHVQRLQAEGKIFSPAELVRQVKQGPGTATLGEAQHAAQSQAEEQAGIEADTQAAVARLESLWTGRSSEAARAGMRPLAEVASSASAALATSQRTMNDQTVAFDTTKNSMVDIADTSPQRSLVDVLSPWETNVEEQTNARNAAIEQNQRIYQGFSQTSDSNGAVMPIDYGQIADTSYADFSLAATDSSGAPPRTSGGAGPDVHADANSPGYVGASAVTPPPGPPVQGGDEPPRDGVQPAPTRSTDVPAASDDTTRAASYVPQPVNPPSGTPYTFGPTGSGTPGGGYPPGGSGAGGYVTGGPNAPGSAGQAGYRPPGSGGVGATPRGPGGPGRMTGAGPFGGAGETGRMSGGSAGTGGPRGTGMPMGAAGAGRGGKNDDAERKTPEYLKEADPQQVFGYDGKATPPVIGEKKQH